ncbi:hypothetical protein SEA_ATUIN_262 [Arthrobacter phage Atuin]|nr:hypothetical protein SEA_ATUIN_61 [Arthrobacter phage Atuin]
MAWNHDLNISDFFHDDDLTITEKAEKISERLKSRPWFDGLTYKEDLEGLLEELTDMEDADDFDMIWDQMYDIFDAERIWVRTL